MKSERVLISFVLLCYVIIHIVDSQLAFYCIVTKTNMDMLIKAYR
jgi:hypothetical protein